MRSYFIESAKSMIKSEGVKTVSARNVAEKAGYSYATLYNYFRDMKDLVFECVKDFAEECREFAGQELHPAEYGPERIKSITRSFIRFFVQYPGIFELFFIESLPGVTHIDKTSELIDSILKDLLRDDWSHIGRNSSKKDLLQEKMEKLHKNMVYGLLLMYLNRRIPADYDSFIASYNENTDMLFNPYYA